MSSTRQDRPGLESTVEDGGDPRFDAALRVQSFEHQRIVSSARQRLFGRGQQPQIGRYTIERRIGAGGMGEVYLADDADLGRKVAVKRVLASSANATHQARLRREARALARLSHPNVVQVYEVGEHEGKTFVAMEFVDGQTLGKWLHEPRTWQAVLDKFLAAGRGLAAVHEAGLVHRDFKPDNVLLSVDGRVLVADFGLVIAGEDADPAAVRGELPRLGPDLRTSVTGAILGTIRYMPLEQLSAGKVDARSDQFSYCVALYEALWGKPPFSLASSLDRLDDLELGKPTQPNSSEGLRPPARLWRVVRRGLAKQADARWPSMNALLEALEGETRRRRRLVSLGAASAAAALLAGAAWLAMPEPESDPCAAIERELEGVWDESRRSELANQLASLEVSHAADSSQRVLAGLDRWSSGWVLERERVCRAGAEQRIEPKLERLQSTCLTRQRQRVEDLVELLGQPSGGDTLARAVKAVAELPAASACEDELALLGVEPPAEAAHDQVEALRRDLGRARELRLLGRLDEGLQQAKASERAASELGYGPLIAEALAELATAEIQVGALGSGAKRMQAAIDVAELHRHESVAANSWLELAVHSLARLDDPLVGSWQLRRAEVANARIAASPRVRARLAFAQARLAELQGDHAQAEQDSRAAIAEAKLDAAARLDLPSYYANLGRLRAEEHPEEAIALQRKALEIAEVEYGPLHPETAGHLYELAVSIEGFEPGNSEVAVLLDRAIDIWAAIRDRPHRDIARSELLLGISALGRQEIDQAELHARKAVEANALAQPENPVGRGDAANLLAIIHSVRGEHELALQQFLVALSALNPRFGSDHAEVQKLRTNIVSTQLALGKIDDAEAGINALLPHVRGDAEMVRARLQLGEIALRRGHLDAADAQLEAIATMDLGLQEYSYLVLRALVDLRRGDLAPALLEQLIRARVDAPFSAEQVETWFDELGLSASERAALAAD